MDNAQERLLKALIGQGSGDPSPSMFRPNEIYDKLALTVSKQLKATLESERIRSENRADMRALEDDLVRIRLERTRELEEQALQRDDDARFFSHRTDVTREGRLERMKKFPIPLSEMKKVVRIWHDQDLADAESTMARLMKENDDRMRGRSDLARERACAAKKQFDKDANVGAAVLLTIVACVVIYIFC